jgi:lipoyl-dependent peroxiredoxin
MGISTATGIWEGPFKTGKGTMKPDHGPAVEFTTPTRFEGATGSNPEEVIGAALAGCFSMALSVGLEKAGMTPQSIRTNAKVHLEKMAEGWTVVKIELSNETRATGGDQATFEKVAQDTKKGCPISRALGAVKEIVLEAKLVT